MPRVQCDHTREDSYWTYDGRGIPLARVCDKCEAATLARYRPDETDVDEPIEPEDY
jgi:hypothetical protein